MKSIFTLLLIFTGLGSLQAQSGVSNQWWRVTLTRPDGQPIVFNFEWKTEAGRPVWYIRNGSERIRVSDLRLRGDSMEIHMPVFESEFHIKWAASKKLEGVWIKQGSVKPQVLSFLAVPGYQRFEVKRTPLSNVSGRWAVTFLSKGKTIHSVGEFVQKGSHLTGSFLNPTGDYRYLEGVVDGDSLLLSCFDGGHAFSFRARLLDNNRLGGGRYYNGATAFQDWTATRDSTVRLDTTVAAMYLKPGAGPLDFTFNDLEGKPVSIRDDRFKNKVVIIQIMGSWCPNCMDETAFLSAYYKKNRHRGLEVIALAYEYTTNLERSRASLRKFQQRFDVQYPLLLTGVSVNDSLRTEKTLPQFTPIAFFPTSIILDKKGRVHKIDTGFNGPGTGTHYKIYVKEFEETIDHLLQEKFSD